MNGEKTVVKIFSAVSKLRTRPELRCWAHGLESPVRDLTDSNFRGLGDSICAEASVSPPVIAQTVDGIAHQYIEGRVLTESDVHTAGPELIHAIGKKYSILNTLFELFQLVCIGLMHCTAYKHRSNTVCILCALHRVYSPLPLLGTSALIWSWLDSMLSHIKSESVSDSKYANTNDVTLYLVYRSFECNCTGSYLSCTNFLIQLRWKELESEIDSLKREVEVYTLSRSSRLIHFNVVHESCGGFLPWRFKAFKLIIRWVRRGIDFGDFFFGFQNIGRYGWLILSSLARTIVDST